MAEYDVVPQLSMLIKFLATPTFYHIYVKQQFSCLFNITANFFLTDSLNNLQ